jgi:membrane-associated protease RseP (regulator of RpoE activity)
MVELSGNARGASLVGIAQTAFMTEEHMSKMTTLPLCVIFCGLATMLAGPPVSDVRAAAAEEQDAGAPHRSDEEERQLPKGVIGVALHVGAERIGDPARLYVAYVHPQGPAHQASVRHGDEVLAVDGAPVAGKTYEQVILMVRGEPGKAVTLTVKGEQGERALSIVRVAGESLSTVPIQSPGGSSK